MSDNVMLSHKEILSNKLIEIEKDITRLDRIEFLKEKSISRFTLYNYLNGDVGSVELAIEMLEFFTPRVKARKEQIDNIEKL